MIKRLETIIKFELDFSDDKNKKIEELEGVFKNCDFDIAITSSIDYWNGRFYHYIIVQKIVSKEFNKQKE